MTEKGLNATSEYVAIQIRSFGVESFFAEGVGFGHTLSVGLEVQADVSKDF